MLGKAKITALAATAAVGLAATTLPASAWYCHGSYQSYNGYYSPQYYQSYSPRSYQNYYPQARYYPRHRMHMQNYYSQNYSQGYSQY
jgi:hypothetical protein